MKEKHESTTTDYVKSYQRAMIRRKSDNEVVCVMGSRPNRDNINECLVRLTNNDRVSVADIFDLYDHTPPETGYYNIVLEDGRELACHFGRNSKRQWSKGLTEHTSILKPALGYQAARNLLGYPAIGFQIVYKQLLVPNPLRTLAEALYMIADPAQCISAAVTRRLAIAATARLPVPSVQLNGAHVGTYDGHQLLVPEGIRDAVQREMEKNP